MQNDNALMKVREICAKDASNGRPGSSIALARMARECSSAERVGPGKPCVDPGEAPWDTFGGHGKLYSRSLARCHGLNLKDLLMMMQLCVVRNAFTTELHYLRARAFAKSHCIVFASCKASKYM